ncbi:MAG: SRPBCC domain-containing protein [Pseudomonadota bacterium]|uniref:SRPBCC domain-containing protein n=1 Tax=Vibrio sp. D173a TaxID=2836349 RepID=UPI0025557F86|nr:SRPBCC domain-containing protein [Vibrio sp. D173a]MDK9758113.1 SRPBCC domain-containing protein [Vibrio sp. D173a]
MNKSEVIWPDYYHPKHAQIHVRSQIEIPEPPEVVWQHLVRAPEWPAWRRAKTMVQILNGDNTLCKNTMFRWKASGFEVKCTVVEYLQNQRLAWKGKKGSIDMYHAWVLEPTKHGCCIITESTQRGGSTWLTKYFAPRRLRKYHLRWLEELCRQSHGHCEK